MRIALVPIALVAALALAACGGAPAASPTTAVTAEPTSPTPTPEPIRPTLDDLVLTPDALGTLRMGGALPDTDDPGTAMVAFDPEYCVNEEYGIGPGDELAGGWKPDSSYDTGDGPAFAITEKDGVLVRLDVYGPDIPTEGGIRVGDSRDAVLAAHPDAELVSESPISELYQEHGTAGDLNIEVKVEGDGAEGYWQGDENTVLVLRLTPAGSEPVPIAGGDNVIFGCGYSGA